MQKVKNNADIPLIPNLLEYEIAGDESSVEAKDSLMADPGDHFELVMTNPPFGKKSSIIVLNDDGKADKEKVVILLFTKLKNTPDTNYTLTKLQL